ncbi:MAG: DUF488 family protein [Pseudomonadales bacterium]|nr:DUF488 family protein [Pseudomonadales bacterium]
MPGREIKVKHIFEPFEPSDGTRVLVEKQWPMGMRKREANIGLWAQNLAPSEKLRYWFEGDPDTWEDFQKYYGKELDDKEADLKDLFDALPTGPVTFVHTSHEDEHNNAVALRNYVIKRRLLD